MSPTAPLWAQEGSICFLPQLPHCTVTVSDTIKGYVELIPVHKLTQMLISQLPPQATKAPSSFGKHKSSLIPLLKTLPLDLDSAL